MKCQACQVRAATVHYSEMGMDDKLTREIHLCEECYAVQKPGGPDILGLITGAMAGGPRPAEDPGTQACPQCGLTYATFRTRGRLGCPQCYEVFRVQLEPLLEKIHGGLQHLGKSPFDAGAGDRSRDRLVLSLRRKLQEAIRNENYELAAGVRDQLRRAELGEDAAFEGTVERAVEDGE